MKLTPDEVRTLAWRAGFRATDLDAAVAIAIAESDLNPDAYNPELDYFLEHHVPTELAQGRGSHGLWQIFTWPNARFRDWALPDPQINACAAYVMWYDAGKSFRPWATYRSGEYLKHLPAARQVAQGGAA